jgi:cell division protein FtsW (lipid II flippase)
MPLLASTAVLLYLGSVLQLLLTSSAGSRKHVCTIAIGLVGCLIGMLVSRAASGVPTRERGPALKGYLWIVGILAVIVTVYGLFHRVNGSAAYFLGLTPVEFFKIALIGFVSLGGVPAMQQDKPLRKAFVIEMLAIAVGQVLVHSVGDGSILAVMILLIVFLGYGGKAAGCAAGLGAAGFVAGIAVIRSISPDSYMLTRLRDAGHVLTQGGSLNVRRGLLTMLRCGLGGSGAGDTLYTSLNFGAGRDFTFTACASIFGAWTGALMVLCYAILALALKQKASQSAENSALCNTGNLTAGLILVESSIHILGNLNLVPFTGVCLPLMSQGGSNMIATLAAIGLAAGHRLPATCFEDLPSGFMRLLARFGVRTNTVCARLVKKGKKTIIPKKKKGARVK